MSEQPSPEGPEFVRAALAVRAEKLRAHVDGVLAADADAIHDMRVASRRLRAALAACAPYLDQAQAKPLVDNARKITRLLGRARELDVMLEMLDTERGRASGPWLEAIDAAEASLRERRAEVACHCAEAAGAAEAYPDTSLAVAQHPIDLAGFSGAVLARAREKLQKRYRRWRKREGDESLHALRVAFKKYRYACELFTGLLPPLVPFVEELKNAQQSLGDWNDCRMLVGELEALRPSLDDDAAQALLRLAFTHRAEEFLAAFHLQAERFFGADAQWPH
jgi:CHAD domain-containing protein